MEHYFDRVEGYFWFQSAYERLLARLPADRPSTVVEVGSYKGRSAVWLGVEILNSGKPVTLHCVDSFLEAGLAEQFAANTDAVRRALGNRFVVHVRPSVEAAAHFAPQSCDAVWLDADHSYESVLADIHAWTPKVRPGGVLGGDDWMMWGVERAVRETGPFELGNGESWDERPGSRGPYPWWWRDL